MGFYARYVLPRLIDLAMRSRVVTARRARIVPLAAGKVLEIGAGSGLNLPFYGERVEKLYALDPSPEVWRLGRRRAARAGFPIEFLAHSGERIPLPDASIDTVVSTWTLCSIPRPLDALAEIRRVLTPDGRFLFIEHGRAPEAGVVAWQDRLTPVWKRIAGGCHLNRAIDALITEAGFEIARLERGYSKGPKPFAYLYEGTAGRRINCGGHA